MRCIITGKTVVSFMALWIHGLTEFSFYSNFSIAVWNQFDGVAFVNTNPDNYYNKIKGTFQSFFSTDKTAEYRKKAFLGSVPKWKGFRLVDEETQQMTATEAIVKLENAMYCLSRVWVEESGNFRRKQPSQFDAGKVRGLNNSSIVSLFPALAAIIA